LIASQKSGEFPKARRVGSECGYASQIGEQLSKVQVPLLGAVLAEPVFLCRKVSIGLCESYGRTGHKSTMGRPPQRLALAGCPDDAQNVSDLTDPVYSSKVHAGNVRAACCPNPGQQPGRARAVAPVEAGSMEAVAGDWTAQDPHRWWGPNRSLHRPGAAQRSFPPRNCLWLGG